jgi:hypothetical protein
LEVDIWDSKHDLWGKNCIASHANLMNQQKN